MYPELFEVPFTHLTVKSYGLMMVIGFMGAVCVIRYLSRSFTLNPLYITNAALYALIAGVLGARLFYVIHYFDRFRGDLLSVVAIWQGGLELVGGVVAAIVFIVLYLRFHKLPVRRYLDVLAVGLMLALAFGRIGCLLNGCCFGKPVDLPWSVRFPYGSLPYLSQVYPDAGRNRRQPHMQLSDDFFGYYDKENLRYNGLKPFELLTPNQKQMVKEGPYRCQPVHPTQLYATTNALILCLILYLFRRRGQKAGSFIKPGSTFALMFIFYGIMRFFMEFLRDDNPFEFDGITISQNISVVMVILGIILMTVFQKVKAGTVSK